MSDTKYASNTGIPLNALSSGTPGELITWGADTKVAAVAVGTAAQVLTSNGAGAAPTFQAAAAGGGLSWGDAISGSDGDEGIDIDINASATANTAGIGIAINNTQANQVYGMTMNLGTGAHATGLQIKGTGTADWPKVHLMLWGNTASNVSKILSIGNGTSYDERTWFKADGRVGICTDANAMGEQITALAVGMNDTRVANINRTADWVTIWQKAWNNAGTYIEDWDVVRIQRDSTTAGTATGTEAGALLKLVNTATETAGTLLDTTIALEIAHGVHADATDVYAIKITSDNSGTGNPGGIDFSSFTAGEPIFKFVADATDPTGAGGAATGRIACDIGGATVYLAYY